MNNFYDSSSEILTAQTDLYDEKGILLIAKGMSVTRKVFEKLQTRNVVRPSKVLPADIQADSILTGPEKSEYQIDQIFTDDDVVSLATRITQQAIDTMKSNSHLQTRMREFVLNQAWVYDHSLNVAQLSTQVALKLTMPADEVFMVSLGALLHDIGRTITENATTSFVLNNDDLVGSSVKHHPVIGSNLLRKAGLPESVCLVALQHHERFSGRGYPRGLAHEETHPHAQIVMLADSFEALTTRRFKNKTLSIAEGLDIVERGRGTNFNPDILDALTGLFQDQI